MPNRVSFSEEYLTIESIAKWKTEVDISIEHLFNSIEQQVYIGNQTEGIFDPALTPNELLELKKIRLKEVELSAELKLLATLEATFRIDYLQRVYGKKKDDLSRAFRHLYKTSGNRARFEDDILQAWKNHSSNPQIFSDLKGAFKYRHWLAHGRYWIPKLGRKYDFFTLYALSEALILSLPFEAS